MARMNMVQALNSAMDVMLERDPRVVILGEDVGFFGGVFRVTDGLQRKYGEHRVLDTRSPRAASSPQPSAWASTASSRSRKSSLPITSIPASIRW